MIRWLKQNHHLAAVVQACICGLRKGEVGAMSRFNCHPVRPRQVTRRCLADCRWYPTQRSESRRHQPPWLTRSSGTPVLPFCSPGSPDGSEAREDRSTGDCESGCPPGVKKGGWPRALNSLTSLEAWPRGGQPERNRRNHVRSEGGYAVPDGIRVS
jgi:hypothetical protein